MDCRKFCRFAGAAVGALVWSAVQGATVPESARDLPRLADVDVVVVGGTMAGVQAAAAAKSAGASVFLVAPRFQLGEEIVTTRALWQEDDEGADDSFVAGLFLSDRASPYTYSYDKTPSNSHPDPDLLLLRDGVANSASQASVQFDADVTVTATLGENFRGTLLSLRLGAYRRAASGGFVTDALTVQESADGSTWTDLPGDVTIQNTSLDGQSDTLDILTFTPSREASPACLRVLCMRAQGYSRQLLAELTIVTANAATAPAKPILVAKALDQVLLDAEVPFLTGSPVTDVLRDGTGRIAGVAVANRNGRQALQAKVVIDATEWAAVARAAGVAFVSGTNATRFTRTVVCEQGAFDATLAGQDGWQVRERRAPSLRLSVKPEDLKGTDAPNAFEAGAYLVSQEFPFATFTYAAWLDIERQMRDATWTASLSDASEKCAFTPPDHVTGEASGAETWPGAAALPLDVLRPKGVAGLYVLGPCADLSRPNAARLQQAGVETLLGRRVGAAAAAETAGQTVLAGPVGLGAAPAAGSEEVHERLSRPLNVGTDDGATVASAGADLPVLAEVDVLVVGGGTAGVPAALAAAGRDRRVLVADILYALGGVAVDNRIGRFYHGNRRGFATNLTAAVKAHGWQFYAASADWQRRACDAAGATVWFGAFAEGVVTDGGDGEGRARVAGVVFALPDGTRGVVRATVTVDATGNADLTAAAGGETTFLDAPEFAGQGVGASNIQLGNSYLNTDIGFLDDTDAGDLSHFMLRSRLALKESWMQPSFPSTGSRERRRIVGDVTVTELDVVRGRTWPDTIMHGLSNFDMHGFSTSPLLMLWEHPADDLAADLPFRALLPRNLEGLLATGLGISATRDAMPILRMQPDVQNQGWAAGLAAAAACGTSGTLRDIDVPALQRDLIAADILDARVVADADGGAVADAELDGAIDALTTDYHGLESILAADRETALSRLRAAYAATTNVTHQTALGTALALLGDATAVDFLVARNATSDWDTGHEFKGLNNYGRQTSALDGTLYALAQTRDPRILGLMGTLGSTLADSSATVRTLSHFRMYNLAVQAYPAAALATPVLAAVAYARETLLGNAFDAVRPASYTAQEADAERTQAIRELVLAEILLRLGDPDGTARASLEAFAADPRTSYAVWARRLLAQEIPDPQTGTNGVWTATAAAGDWTAEANWRDGRVAEGATATATFEGLADGTRQTVGVPDDGLQIGALAFADAADRTFTGGLLSFLSPMAFLDVAEGGSVAFQNDVKSTNLEKTGTGTATFAGAVQLDNRLAVAAGAVRLANGATARAVAGDTFTVGADEEVWLTHIGCRADEIAAQTAAGERLRIVLANAAGTKIEAVLFTARHRGFEQDGYRYLRVGNPYPLTPGATYTLQVSASGCHPGALLAGRAPEQKLADAAVDGRLEIASPFATVGTLSGTGVVAAVAASPVNLELAADRATTVFDGTLDATGAPFALTKTGSRTATLHGVRGIRDGISPRRGMLVLDSPEALEPDATIIFGSRDNNPAASGSLAFAADDAIVSNPVACAKMGGYNFLNNGFAALAGRRLTLRDVEVTTPDSICAGSCDGTLALIATHSATDETLVVAENVDFPYIDLTAQVYGEENSPVRGANAVVLRNVSSGAQGLRKLTTLNIVSNSVGGTLTIAGSSLSADWFDFSGPYVGFNLTTGSTLVASVVRFPNNNKVQHSNADILIDGGARLVADGIPSLDGSAWHTTNTVLRFDDAVLQIKSRNNPDFFPLPAENPPAEILAGGLTLDLSAFDIALTNGYPFRSLRISHPLTSPAAGTPGPLTVLGGDPSGPNNGGECKLAAPMSFAGPTTVRGGTLVFDFKAAPELETILAPGTDLVLDGGALDLQSDAAGRRQAFAAITNAAATPATLTIAAGCRVETAALVGAGGFAVKGGTLALDLPLSEAQRLNGSLVLDGATLAVATVQTQQAPELIPGGSFEPTPEALPEPGTSNTSALDKRGSRDAAWLKANVADWTFDASDNVGVARNGSYFTSAVRDGVTCAFLRNASGKIRRTFTVAQAARYTLVFDWRSRFYNNTLYKAQIQVLCDGAVVHTTEVSQADDWVETTVDLGLLEPGEHVFAFGSVVDGGDALLDVVRLGYTATPLQADLERMVSPELVLDLRNGAKVELDFEGRLSAAELRVDGAKRYGLFSAETYPDLFSGTGSIFCKPRATMIILR
ncbi:MAG: FAD-dependent oxidoreductase [Kiritimatiellia bacterium]